MGGEKEKGLNVPDQTPIYDLRILGFFRLEELLCREVVVGAKRVPASRLVETVPQRVSAQRYTAREPDRSHEFPRQLMAVPKGELGVHSGLAFDLFELREKVGQRLLIEHQTLQDLSGNRINGWRGGGGFRCDRHRFWH